jgi:hypothetical protein
VAPAEPSPLGIKVTASTIVLRRSQRGRLSPRSSPARFVRPRRNRIFNPQIKSRPPFVPVPARSLLFNDLRPELFPLIPLFARLSGERVAKSCKVRSRAVVLVRTIPN